MLSTATPSANTRDVSNAGTGVNAAIAALLIPSTKSSAVIAVLIDGYAEGAVAALTNR